MESVFAKDLIEKAKKLGVKSAQPLAPEIAAKLGISITEYQGRYFIPKLKTLPQTGKKIKTCMRLEEEGRLTRKLREEERHIKSLALKYKKISEDDMASMGYIMKRVMKVNHVADIFGKPINNQDDVKQIQEQLQNTVEIDMNCIENEMVVIEDDEKIDIVHELVDCYYDIAAIQKKLEEWKLDDQYLKDNVRIHRKKGDFVPSSINEKSETDNFMSWLNNKSTATDTEDSLFFI